MDWTFLFKFKEYKVAIKTTTKNKEWPNTQCLKEYLKYKLYFESKRIEKVKASKQ